jgi:hypothetical protein
VFVAFAVGVKASRGGASGLGAPAALGAAIAAVTAAAAAAGGPAGHIVHANPALTIASFLFACGGWAGAKAAAAHLAAQALGATVATAGAVSGLGLWPARGGAGEAGPATPALGEAESLLAGAEAAGLPPVAAPAAPEAV